MRAVASPPVRELTDRRLVQEMARRRAQTSAWGRRYPSAVLFAQSEPEWSMVLPRSARLRRALAGTEKGVPVALKG